MEFTTSEMAGDLCLTITGRLDGSGADDLSALLERTVRDGHHNILIELSGVNYISSAGIGVLVRYFKRLRELQGDLRIFQASRRVLEILNLTGLVPLLVRPLDKTSTAALTHATQSIERNGIRLDITELAPGATLSAALAGNTEHLLAPPTAWTGQMLECDSATLGIGLGVLGDDLEEAHFRVGEFLTVAGATVHQPPAGSGVADYMLAQGALVPKVSALSAILCRGQLAQSAKFQSAAGTDRISLVNLASTCCDLTNANAAAVVILAESAGVVGASLRRTPLHQDRFSFAHPEIRSWLSFTAERAFSDAVTLVVGVIARKAPGHLAAALRPLGNTSLSGHFHGAAFSYRPLTKAQVNLQETVHDLLQNQRLESVLHLIVDDRPDAGAGDTEFLRGTCWFGPIAEVAA